MKGADQRAAALDVVAEPDIEDQQDEQEQHRKDVPQQQIHAGGHLPQEIRPRLTVGDSILRACKMRPQGGLHLRVHGRVGQGDLDAGCQL